MSRIGKKPIAIPAGVKISVVGNTVVVQGPKGKVEAHLPSGIQLEQKDGVLNAVRESDEYAAVHGLARALVGLPWDAPEALGARRARATADDTTEA